MGSETCWAGRPSCSDERAHDPPEIAIAVAVGLGAGVLSGLFGVGGGIVMTPGVQVLLGAPPIVALATPLPVMLPTALAGALTYRRRGSSTGGRRRG